MLAIGAAEAAWYLPFVAPICLYVAFTDLRDMKITNKTVLLLAGLFLVLGLITLPIVEYGWRLFQLFVVLAIGFVLNAAGIMGGGDAKFVAAAAPYVALPDVGIVFVIYTITMLAAVLTHRIARRSGLRRLAPNWVSWESSPKFPMGFVLGPTLAIYLAAGVVAGA